MIAARSPGNGLPDRARIRILNLKLETILSSPSLFTAQSEPFAEQLSYWKKRLEVCPDLALPTDRPRRTSRKYRNAKETLRLPSGLVEGLKTRAGQENVTLFAVMLSALQALLHRYTASQIIVTACPIQLGASENWMAASANFSEDPTFGELLAQSRSEIVEASVCKDLPLKKVMEALQLEPNAGFGSLFQVTFQLRGLQEKAEGLSCPKSDLSLEIDVESFECMLNYDAELFEPGTAQRMLGHYRTILEAVSEGAEQRVSRLPILTPQERKRVLEEWNETHAGFPRVCLHQLFEEQVLRTPDAPALVCKNQQLTYAELNGRANRLAHVLQCLGVGPEVIVAISIERSIEMVVGLLAILKAGGAYAPLDPAYPQERLAFMLEDLQAPVLLCGQTSMLQAQYAGKILRVEEWAPLAAGQPPENLACESGPENLAYVLYTSGSTGRPKGVLISHKAIVNYLHWCITAYSANQGQGSPVHTPLGFDLTITSLYPPLLTGCTAILLPEDSTLEVLATALRTGDFSLVKLTPAHLEALRHKFTPDEPAIATRMFVIGGEALHGELLNSWRKQSPNIRLINEYGPTEATVGCCVYELSPGRIAPSAVPIGRPISNTRLYVLDHNLQPVPIGVAGELYIGGSGLARGYHRRPEENAEKFIPDPFNAEPGARLYKTGDLVRYRCDGNLEFLGRLDHQVKIRGFRVELNEIAAVLSEHPGVRDVLPATYEAAAGDRRIVAYVVADRYTPSLEQQLRNALKLRLPEYMHPVRYIFLPALPLTSNGKVDRAALPDPRKLPEKPPELLEAPRDDLELQLVKLWEEILQTAPISRTEDFFDLGGNSLLAIRMLVRLEKMIGEKVPLSVLLNAPTIAQFSQALKAPIEQPRVFAIQPLGSAAPFFCVGAGPLFRAVASGLGFHRPFLGLRLPEAHVLPTPYCMEDIATYCSQTLLKTQPQGPYYLGGWSDGGIVAYEIAQQLRRQGHLVSLLVLFDSENPQWMKSFSPIVSARVRLAFLGQWIRLHWKTLQRSNGREMVEYLRRGLEFRLAWLKGRMWSLAYRLRLRAGWRINTGLQNMEHVSGYVTRSYKPLPYDGDVLLFRRGHRPVGRYRDPQYGWGQLVGRLEFQDVPGDHVEMFLPPNVRIMTEKLRDRLEEKPCPAKPAAGGV